MTSCDWNNIIFITKKKKKINFTILVPLVSCILYLYRPHKPMRMRYDQLANIFTKSHLLGQLSDLASKTKLTFDNPFWNWGKFSCESTQYSFDCGPSPLLAYKSVYSIHKLFEAKSTQPDALCWLKFYFEFRDEGGTGWWLGLEFWFLHSFLWRSYPLLITLSQ